MPLLVRRRTALVSLLTSLSVLGVVACSSDDAGHQPGDDAGAESKDVVLSLTNRYGFSNGNLGEVAKGRQSATATLQTTADGSPKTITGTTRADGAIVFADVPQGPYVLELR